MDSHEELTVNDEDLSFSSRDVEYIKEVDVVLSKRHHRLVAGAERSLLDIGPGECSRVGCRLCSHVQVEEIRSGDGVEDVGVVVKDGSEIGCVELASSDGLLRPGFLGGVINVHRRCVRRVTVQDVDSVIVLRKVASGVSCIEGSVRSTALSEQYDDRQREQMRTDVQR